MLGIEQKKGDPDHLCGHIIAYAKIVPAGNVDRGSFPFADLVHNGLLVVRGDFEGNETIKNFMQNKFGTSVKDGISEIIDRIHEQGGELPEGIDPDELREKMDEFANMEVIPVPAKIIRAESEEQLLKENADIYYVGKFTGMSQVHLCITSLPIFYQAQYREQQTAQGQEYINEILAQIEGDDVGIKKTEEDFLPVGTLDTFMGNLYELLNKKVVPFLLYQVQDELEYRASFERFHDFMSSYSPASDVDAVSAAIRALRADEDDKIARARVELLCKKMSAIYDEKFEDVPELAKRLAELDSGNAGTSDAAK